MNVVDSLSIFKIIVFSEKGLSAIKKTKLSLVLFILAVFIQAIPASISDYTSFLVKFGINAAAITLLLGVVFGILYLVSKGLGSKIKFKQYASGLASVTFVVSFVSIISALFLIYLGSATGFSEIAFSFIQGSIIVFYLFVVFGWCAEKLAGFDENKGMIIGLLAVTLMYGFHLLISALP